MICWNIIIHDGAGHLLDTARVDQVEEAAQESSIYEAAGAIDCQSQNVTEEQHTSIPVDGESERCSGHASTGGPRRLRAHNYPRAIAAMQAAVAASAGFGINVARRVDAALSLRCPQWTPLIAFMISNCRTMRKPLVLKHSPRGTPPLLIPHSLPCNVHVCKHLAAEEEEKAAAISSRQVVLAHETGRQFHQSATQIGSRTEDM
jgi:hypothetical protein